MFLCVSLVITWYVFSVSFYHRIDSNDNTHFLVRQSWATSLWDPIHFHPSSLATKSRWHRRSPRKRRVSRWALAVVRWFLILRCSSPTTNKNEPETFTDFIKLNCIFSIFCYLFVVVHRRTESDGDQSRDGQKQTRVTNHGVSRSACVCLSVCCVTMDYRGECGVFADRVLGFYTSSQTVRGGTRIENPRLITFSDGEEYQSGYQPKRSIGTPAAIIQ